MGGLFNKPENKPKPKPGAGYHGPIEIPDRNNDFRIAQKLSKFEQMEADLRKKYPKIRTIDIDSDVKIVGDFPSTVDFSFKPVSADERIQLLQNNTLTNKYNLQTDVYIIEEKGNVEENDFKRKEMIIHWKKHVDTSNLIYYNYLAGVKNAKSEWTIIEIEYENSAFIFMTTYTERVCVLYLAKEEQHTISSTGSVYTSSVDNDVKITFPEGAVSENKDIDIQIDPVSQEYLRNAQVPVPEVPANKKDDLDSKSRVLTGVSARVSVTHISFSRPVEVQLPMTSIFETGLNVDMQFVVFKITEDNTMQQTEDKVFQKDGKFFINVNSFSSYLVSAASLNASTESVKTETERAHGIKDVANILFFVKRIDQRNLLIFLECVRKDNVENVKEARQNERKCEYVKEWTSHDIEVIPNKTIFAVDIRGKFKVHKDSQCKHPQISYIPIAYENFCRFQVELDPSLGKEFGVLSIRNSKGIVYEIFYDPRSTIPIPQNLLGRGLKSAPFARNPSAHPRRDVELQNQSSFRTKSSGKRQGSVINQFIPDEFLNENGLIIVAEKLDIFKVCISVGMKQEEINEISHQCHFQTGRYMMLLKEAIKRQNGLTNAEKLLNVLEKSNENLLADKIRRLKESGKELSKIDETN